MGGISLKHRNIPEFPIHYYRQIFAKIGTHDKITLFFLPFSWVKIGTVLIK